MPDTLHHANPASFAINSRRDGDATIIAVSGELDVASSDQLKTAILAAEKATGPIVLNLEGLSFLDSTGLNVLLEARRRSRDNGDRLRCVGSGHDQVVRLLAVTDTTEVLLS